MNPLVKTLMVGVVALLAVGCVAEGTARWTYAPLPTRAPNDAPAATAAPSHPPAETPTAAATDSGNVVGQLEFRAYDLGFEPATMAVAGPGRYAIVLVNDGAIPHDITFPDGTHIHAEAGETARGEVVVPAEGIDFICSIPGHEQGGMVGSISVEGVAAPTAEPTGDPDDHGGPPPQTNVEPDPNAPAPVLHDPAAPDRLEGELHELELVMTERPMTVAPGFVQQVWTFGDEVPGPVLRVKVGDTIRVRLVNSPENQLPHSLDFHSSMVAWNDEMRSINPGEELIYEWVANHAGVWMYHCGTSPALHHIANGMYGMVIVEPEGGLDPVAHEYAFVQSEWYLGPQGQPTDLAKAMEAAPEPDFVVFNGVANQYVDAPIQVPTGERVRVFVLNAGPSVDSSFHIVGTIFDRVIKEGVELERGNPGAWGSQAVDLAPAQGAIVEFVLAEDGLYPMVTHAFNFVGRGALGLFQAGDGDPAAE